MFLHVRGSRRVAARRETYHGLSEPHAANRDPDGQKLKHPQDTVDLSIEASSNHRDVHALKRPFGACKEREKDMIKTRSRPPVAT